MKNTQQAKAQTVVTPLGNKTAKTLAFIGSFVNGFVRGTSTGLKLATTVVEATETTVIIATKKATQVTKLDTTRAGKAFGKGFNEGQDVIDALTKVGNELGQLDATTVKAFAAKAK